MEFDDEAIVEAVVATTPPPSHHINQSSSTPAGSPPSGPQRTTWFGQAFAGFSRPFSSAKASAGPSPSSQRAAAKGKGRARTEQADKKQRFSRATFRHNPYETPERQSTPGGSGPSGERATVEDRLRRVAKSSQGLKGQCACFPLDPPRKRSCGLVPQLRPVHKARIRRSTSFLFSNPPPLSRSSYPLLLPWDQLSLMEQTNQRLLRRREHSARPPWT